MKKVLPFFDDWGKKKEPAKYFFSRIYLDRQQYNKGLSFGK